MGPFSPCRLRFSTIRLHLLIRLSRSGRRHASDELPMLVRPDERWQTDGRREIASWTDTRGHYQLTEWKQSPRRRGKMSSSDTNEGWFVLEGILDFDVGAKHFSAVRGAFVFVPAQTTHRAWNAGATPARYLAIRSPAAP